MKNITLATCSYNTPDVTITMLKSFFKHHDECKVLICENSTDDETQKLLKQHNVPYFTNYQGLHSPSIDLLIDKCTTDYMLLVDTDVIFLKPHQDIFESMQTMDVTLLGEVCGDRGGKQLHNRVHPWHCFINIKHIKDNNIKFYDYDRQIKRDGDKIYDVGASFFEDIRKVKLKIGNVSLQDDYYKHYEGMSWRTLKYGNTEGNIDVDSTATHANIELFKYGKFIERMYQLEISTYEHIKINAI